MPHTPVTWQQNWGVVFWLTTLWLWLVKTVWRLVKTNFTKKTPSKILVYILTSHYRCISVVTHVCKTANSELRKIASVRSLLIQTEGTTVQLASSLILSCLDYCNYVLAGLPFEELLCLQKIQNNAARLVFQKPKQDHVTPLMSELHWLPVKFRVQYKLATLASCCFDGSLPPCPSSLLNIY